jgi:hypothetical protein
MPLLENLAQGFANAAGATDASNAIQQNKNRRQNLSDVELEDAVQAHMDVMKGIQAKLGANPNDPELTKALSGERDQLFQLLHPANNPDALGKVKQLFRHVFRQQEPPQKQPVNNLPSVAAMTAAAPKPAEDPNTGLSPEDVMRKHRIAARLEPPATAEKETPTKYQPQLTTTTDPTDGKKHYWRVPMEEGGKPEEVAFQGQEIAPKGSAGKPTRAWINKGGKITSVLLDPQTNKEIPGSENSDIQPPPNMAGRITEGFHYWIDDDNKLHKTPQETISHPLGAGGGASKPPGEQKKDLANMTNKSGAKGDKILGTIKNAAASAADKDVVVAVKLSSQADQIAKNPNDAVGQKRLAEALQRASAGRFQQQAMEFILGAGWSNKLQTWAQQATTGTLAPDVVRQLVDAAHQNLIAAREAQKEAHKSGGEEKKGKHSLAKAMQLPFNKGKSEADVRKDLESHGYEVIP